VVARFDAAAEPRAHFNVNRPSAAAAEARAAASAKQALISSQPSAPSADARVVELVAMGFEETAFVRRSRKLEATAIERLSSF